VRINYDQTRNAHGKGKHISKSTSEDVHPTLSISKKRRRDCSTHKVWFGPGEHFNLPISRS